MAQSPRIRTLFIPAVATLASQGVLLALFFSLGIYDKTLWREPTFSPPVYLVFWLGLVPVGALGAWLSRRAGGTVVERIFSALTVVLGKIVGYILMLPIALLLSGRSSLHFVYGGFSFVLLKYICAPGCALLLGAMPFLGTGMKKIRTS